MKEHAARSTRINIQKALTALEAAIIHLDRMITAIERDNEEDFDKMETHMLDCLSSALHWTLEAPFSNMGFALNHEVLVSLFCTLKSSASRRGR